jgi:methylenetetrahydrofolate dehydrogenase (NADP+)/methenyltetrahydrofolate cyclohydrolase
MTAQIIDGKAVAASLRARLADLVPGFTEQAGRAPGLAVVLVGEDPASHVYVRSKGRATREAGMESFEHRLGADASEGAQMNEAAVIAAIDPAKDVDGFHVINAGRLAAGLPGLVPCTPLGCLALLKDRLGSLAGLHALVIGRSNIVGKPMAQLLLGESATVTIAHSRTRDLPQLVGQADIVVAAVGRPEMIRGEWLKPGATVIDVGINRVPGEGGKDRLVGDVHFASAVEVAGAITPVPGGVGPMTIAMLLRNTFAAAHARAGIAQPAEL